MPERSKDPGKPKVPVSYWLHWGPICILLGLCDVCCNDSIAEPLHLVFFFLNWHLYSCHLSTVYTQGDLSKRQVNQMDWIWGTTVYLHCQVDSVGKLQENYAMEPGIVWFYFILKWSLPFIRRMESLKGQWFPDTTEVLLGETEVESKRIITNHTGASSPKP